MEALIFMLPPFAACLTLIGILGYFGIHVLKRGIIFIDIAMAQIAALGSALALILHINPDNQWTYYISLAFVILTAWFFSSLKNRQPRICMEAIIGMSYAVAATAAVILIDKAAGSHEHLKEMLIGSILWVQWPEIIKSFIVYIFIGGLHYIFRQQFITLSEDYETARRKGMKTQRWDFLFFLTLGIVVMHSVRIAGILIVFAFLIIPASISVLFSQNWLSRIFIGWFIGTIVSILGLILSWQLDVPSGPAVVLFLGVFLLLTFLGKSIYTIKQGQA